jgi:tRNA A22 N-methylase
VLQPLTEPGPRRRGRAQRDYGIAAERLVRDGQRFYTVIAADRGREDRFAGHPVLDRDDLYEAGPCLVRCGDPLVKKLWLREREAQLRLLERVAGAGRRAVQRRLELAGRILAALDAGPV